MKTPFMVGQHVYVRGLERSDLPQMVEWINDHEVTQLLFTGHRPANHELLEKQWEHDHNSQNDVVLAVCDKKQDIFVGTTGFYSINWIMRTAELRVFIGNKNYWNRGIGTDCIRLMFVYGFEKLNLNRIWGGVNVDNIKSVRACEKAGFVKEGILRQEQYRNFRYYDVVRMSILRTEYEKIRNGYLGSKEKK